MTVTSHKQQHWETVATTEKSKYDKCKMQNNIHRTEGFRMSNNDNKNSSNTFYNSRLISYLYTPLGSKKTY